MPTRRTCLLAALLFLSGVCPAAETTQPARAEQRTFLFTYDATVTGLPPGTDARVWLPVPPNTEAQRVELVAQTLPAPAALGSDAATGNRMLAFEAAANADGEIPMHLTYKVTRYEIGELPSAAATDAAADLKANRLVPIGGAPQKLLVGHTLPTDALQRGRALYDVVFNNMTYRKDQPGWGRGDASWACDSHFGNCTDFHSLFMSLARTSGLPAKFEIGFGIPEKHGAGDVAGYHCWALFKPQGHGWVPVDISEASKHPEKRDYFFGHLCANRVAFSTGRDLNLVPKQSGEPLNYFVYPYVEVGDKPLPAEKLKKAFSYQDLGTPATGPAALN